MTLCCVICYATFDMNQISFCKFEVHFVEPFEMEYVKKDKMLFVAFKVYTINDLFSASALVTLPLFPSNIVGDSAQYPHIFIYCMYFYLIN